MNVHDFLKLAAAKTKALDNHPALKGKQRSSLPDKIQSLIIKKKMEKTAASKAQIRRADKTIADLEGKAVLSLEEGDRLSRAQMVKDRQSRGMQVRHNKNLLRGGYPYPDMFGIGEGVARGELQRNLAEGKKIGDAKRAGKITVRSYVDTPIGKVFSGLKKVEPNIKGSGLTSDLQPTTRFAMGKQRASDLVKKVFRR